MAISLNRRAKLTLLLLGSLLALTLGLISGPAAAQASTSNYCGGWKGPWVDCGGASRQLYQTYGWGDQASVCVGMTYSSGGWSCSSGAGSGVYSGQLAYNVTDIPRIKNNSGVNNYVHGVALTH